MPADGKRAGWRDRASRYPRFYHVHGERGYTFLTRNIAGTRRFHRQGQGDSGVRARRRDKKELGVSVAVENHPGKAGEVGTSYFLGLPDDGRFILLDAAEFLSSNILFQKAPYSLDDLSLLAFLELDYDCLSVPEESPYRTFSDLSSAILENPGSLRVSYSPGVPANIILDYLTKKFQWKVKNILCEGAAMRRKALAEGAIDFCLGVITSAIRNRERCLIVYRNERYHLLPDVPALGEVVGERVPMMGTSRFVATRSTLRKKYPKRFRKLAETLQKTCRRDDYQKALEGSQTQAISVYFDPKNSKRVLRDLHEVVVEYKNSLAPK